MDKRKSDEFKAGEGWLIVLILYLFAVACFGTLIGA
jgi:hypothetical protein